MRTPFELALPSHFCTLLLSAACSLLLLSVGAAAQQRPGGIHAGLKFRYFSGAPLTLIRPGDAEFQSILDTSFPGFSARSDYSQWEPYLVLVRNDTSRYARAYAVRWRIAQPEDGQTYVVNWAMTTPFGMGRRWFDRAINPGHVRLLSPVFNLSTLDWTPWASRPNEWLPPHAASRLPPPTLGVTALLDGVVWGNGGFYGPNETHVLERYFILRIAEHDEALSIRDLIESATPAEKIAVALERRQLRARFDQGQGARAIYIRGRGSSARNFAEILQAKEGGIGALKRTVEQLVELMPPHDQTSRLGKWYAAKFKDHNLGAMVKQRGLEPYLPLTKQ